MEKNLADFVIITALQEELKALLEKFPSAQQLPPADGDVRIYYQVDLPITMSGGATGTYRLILLSLLGMGRVQAANATNDAIRRWRPRYVLLVGKAAGIAAARVQLGDVLISDQVVDYELQKLTTGGSSIRWEVHRADPRLLGAARHLGGESWPSLIKEQRPHEGMPGCFIGPIATGDKVVAIQDVLQHYQSDWPQLIGIEMEAGGVASAAFQAARQPGFLMIRGVSDLADEHKDDTWRSYACHVAAAYTLALLLSGPVPFSLPFRIRRLWVFNILILNAFVIGLTIWISVGNITAVIVAILCAALGILTNLHPRVRDAPKRAKRISRRSFLGFIAALSFVDASLGALWFLSSMRTSEGSSIPQGKTFHIYRGHKSSVTAVSWSPNEPRIASGSLDKKVQVWDATNGNHLFTYSGHSDNVFAVAWSPNGKYIASGGGDSTVQVWDATNGRLINTYRGHRSEHVHGLAWSPDSKRIVSVSSGGLVKVWDAMQGETLFSYPGHSSTFLGHYNFVDAVAWSPDGGRIVSADYGILGNVQLWDATSGNTIHVCYGHTDWAYTVAWSPDSKRFASGSKDKTARVWDGFGGDGIQTYRGHSGSVKAVAWSPRGRYIASGSDDSTVQVWEALNDNPLYIYRGHSDIVETVAWSPDGMRIASGGNDNTVRIWQAM